MAQKRNKVNHAVFVQRMQVLHPRIEVQSTYKAATTPVKCKCLDCSYEWEARPSNLTFKDKPTGCPRCAGSLRKTHAEFVDELARIHPEIDVRSIYSGAHTPVTMYCKIHDYEFKAIPTNVLRRTTTGCLACLENERESRLATQLKQYCLEHFEGVVTEYRAVVNPITGKWMPYDIYIPDINGEKVFCEVMGQQHQYFVPYLQKTEAAFYRQLARDDYKERYALIHGRYVAIDLRTVHTLEQAVSLLSGDQESWLSRMARSTPCADGELSDWFITSAYMF